MATPNYDSTQSELYSISETMYGNFQPDDINDFLAHKPLKYVPGFFTAITGRRTTAFNMPDDEQTSSIHESFRTKLIGYRVICTDNFGRLKSFIDDGWPENEQKTKDDEAGQTVMREALKNNWEKVVSLNKKMTDFMAAYPTELAAGFMPATFPAEVAAAIVIFNDGYTAFKASRQTGTATGGKITANNLVEDDMKSIEKDANVIYKYDPEKLKRYTISVIKNLISPPGSAGLKVSCIQIGTNLPMANLQVIIQAKDGIAKTGTTDAEGDVLFDNIDPGRYTVTIKQAGQPDIVIIKEVNTGTAARLEVVIP